MVYDELLDDGLDQPLNYREQGLTKLMLLFDGKVEAGASEFSKLTVHRYHIIEPPSEEAEGES